MKLKIGVLEFIHIILIGFIVAKFIRINLIWFTAHTSLEFIVAESPYV